MCRMPRRFCKGVPSFCSWSKLLGVSLVCLQLLKSQKGFYPAAAPVGNLQRRLKNASRKLRSPIVKFTVKPCQELTADRAWILQGRNQEGKTTLLRETMPRHRRWGPLALEGIYPNGAKGKSVDSFEKWLTTQMWCMTTTGGSEIDSASYKSKQWFLGFVDCPSPPSPPLCWWISLKSSWSASQCKPWTEQTHWPDQPAQPDNLARVIFVCNSDAGSQTLLNLNQATRFDRVIMEPVSGEDVMTWTRSCSRSAVATLACTSLWRTGSGGRSLPKSRWWTLSGKPSSGGSWTSTCPTPWSMTGHGQSWTWSWWKRGWKSPLSRHSAQRRRIARRFSPKRRSTLIAKGIWKYLDQQQILDTAEELWREMLEGAGAEPAVALALASQIKGIMCSPVPTRWGCFLLQLPFCFTLPGSCAYSCRE